MSQPVLLKVYASFAPANAEDRKDLERACAGAIASEEDHEPFVTVLGGMVRLSFEGIYFPVEDVVPIVERMILAGAKGKLDVLDLENWCLTRYEARDGKLRTGSAPLNNVLDYSGH